MIVDAWCYFLWDLMPCSLGIHDHGEAPILSNAQDLWIGLGKGASRNAEGVPSRVIDFWSSSMPALARGSGRHACAQRSKNVSYVVRRTSRL